MPSVDDLVIQLRIDEGSNLSKLKKQLDALVGPEGKGKIQAGVGISPKLDKNIDFIKNRILYLTSTQIPTDPLGLKREAGSWLLKMQEKVLRESIKTKYDKDEAFMSRIDRILLEIAEGQKVGREAQNLLDKIGALTYRSSRPMGEGFQKKAIYFLEKAIKEEQATWAKTLREADFPIIELLRAFVVEEKDMMENIPKIKNFFDDMLDKVPGARDFFNELMRNAESINWDKQTDALVQLAELIDLKITPALFESEEYIKETEDRAKKLATTVAYIYNMAERTRAFSRGPYMAMSHIPGVQISGEMQRQQYETDITLIGKVDEFLDLYPELRDLLGEDIENMKTLNLELKSVAEKSNLGQLTNELHAFGNALLLAADFPHYLKEFMEQQKLGYLKTTPEAFAIKQGTLEDISERIKLIEEATKEADADIRNIVLTTQKKVEDLFRVSRTDEEFKIMLDDVITGAIDRVLTGEGRIVSNSAENINE